MRLRHNSGRRTVAQTKLHGCTDVLHGASVVNHRAIGTVYRDIHIPRDRVVNGCPIGEVGTVRVLIGPHDAAVRLTIGSGKYGECTPWMADNEGTIGVLLRR